MNRRMAQIEREQRRVANLVTAEFPQYYLTGGTALAFHFNHRLSEDLDFFTQNYKATDHPKIMKFVKKETGYDWSRESEEKRKGFLPMAVYSLGINKNVYLRIDFMQDGNKNIKEIKNGLHSIEDIYVPV